MTTEPTLLTNQEIFDKVARHLLTQGERSMDGEGICSYRSEDGLSCAVGCLIPDEVYTPEIEGDIVPGLFRYRPVVMAQSGLGFDSLDLLARLQDLHDDWSPVAFWGVKLREVAVDFGLNTSILNEFTEETEDEES